MYIYIYIYIYMFVYSRRGGPEDAGGGGLINSTNGNNSISTNSSISTNINSTIQIVNKGEAGALFIASW